MRRVQVCSPERPARSLGQPRRVGAVRAPRGSHGVFCFVRAVLAAGSGHALGPRHVVRRRGQDAHGAAGRGRRARARKRALARA
eukprot:5393271-Pleurochrysis_carterae.AAC.1